MFSIKRTSSNLKQHGIQDLKVCFTIVLSLFPVLSMIPTAITITPSFGLQQVAGDIVVDIKPGETKTFSWGLLSEKNETSIVNITANGIGAEFLSFPENVTLTASGQITYVPVNVSISSNYTGTRELNPSIHATQAGEEIGSTIINIAMSKVLCVVIAQNNTTTSSQDFQGLELKDYTHKVVTGDPIGNQSITIPIKSTSNITEFSFNETKNQISFKASGDAGTNGTTILYVGQVLQEPYSLVLDRIPSTDFDIITNGTTGEKDIQITYRHSCIDNEFILTGSGMTIPS